MLTTLVRRQLIAFVLVTALAVGVLLVVYLRVPAKLGIGRYDVSLALPDAGGLYAGAPVTFRGSQVGEISSVGLTRTGVVARLSLEKSVSIPRDSRAEVADGSVIGEPYLDLVPTSGGDAAPLRSGDTIPASQVSLPIKTGRLFQQADRLLGALPDGALTTTIDEAARALQGNQDALTGIIDSGQKLTDAATSNLEPTTDLLDKLQPVLATQQRLQSRISSSVDNLDALTAALAESDPSIRRLLARGPATAARVDTVITKLHRTLPGVLTATEELTDVLAVYHPAIKSLLITIPALIEAQSAVAIYEPDQKYGEAGLSFKLQVNDPPTCDTGFPEAGHQRAPEDTSPKALPKDSYCKVPHDDPEVVRGARNMPCPNNPALRGATAAQCGLVFDKSGRTK